MYIYNIIYMYACMYVGGSSDNSGQSHVSQQDQALRDEARAGCQGARGPAHIYMYICIERERGNMYV